jgi:AcrR family transcriptional regulator
MVVKSPREGSNRQRVLDAAVDLLGREGVRALTHLRIDERAGLPKGTASNHFRTRAALLKGVGDTMVASELPEVTRAFMPATADDLVDELVALFDFMTGPNRILTSARMAMIVEASHDEELRSTLASGRAMMERTVAPAFAALGARDPQLATDALAACFEGLFLHRLARHADIDPRPVIDLVVRAGLGVVRAAP